VGRIWVLWAIGVAGVAWGCGQERMPREWVEQDRAVQETRLHKLLPFPRDFQPRDRRFVAPRRRDAVRARDLTHLQSAVKDQGNRGSCAFMGAMGLIEHAAKRGFNGEKELNFSEEYMIYYTKAVLRQGSFADGSHARNNLRSIKKSGLLLEEDMPYTHTWFARGLPCENEDEKTSRRVECFAHARPSEAQLGRLIKPDSFQFELFSNCTDKGCDDKLDWIVQRIDQDQATLVDIPLHQDGWTAADGVVTYTEEQHQYCLDHEGDEYCGGHVIVLTGYDLDARTFRFKNSWGSGWGDSGYGTIGFDYIDGYSEQGSLHAATLSGLDPGLQNSAVAPDQVEDVSIELVPDQQQGGEPGLLVNARFRYLGARGTFFSAAATLYLRQEEEDKDVFYPIWYTDPAGEVQYLRSQRFALAREPQDFLYTPESPLSFFIPYRQLLEASIFQGADLFVRQIIFQIKDTQSLVLLSKKLLPVSLPRGFPCVGLPWPGMCHGSMLTFCASPGKVVTRDCAVSDRVCSAVTEGESTVYACVAPSLEQPG